MHVDLSLELESLKAQLFKHEKQVTGKKNEKETNTFNLFKISKYEQNKTSL